MVEVEPQWQGFRRDHGSPSMIRRQLPAAGCGARLPGQSRERMSPHSRASGPPPFAAITTSRGDGGSLVSGPGPTASAVATGHPLVGLRRRNDPGTRGRLAHYHPPACALSPGMHGPVVAGLDRTTNARDYETRPDSSEAMIHIAMIDNFSRRITDESTPTWRGTY